MAITTYAELQTSVANFLARDDLTAQIPDFIALAEARMGRELDTRSQIKRATAETVAGAEFIDLPTDLRKIQGIKINSNPVKLLDYATSYDYYNLTPSNGTGTPSYYTVVGTAIGLRLIHTRATEIYTFNKRRFRAASAKKYDF